jgi:hypothetical protein
MEKRGWAMAELCVTASEFRVHMKMYGNQVSSDQDRVVVMRHDRRLFAVVSEEDFEFLQKHKPNPQRAPVPDPVPGPDIPDVLDYPDNMETDEILRIYNATENVVDDERILRWRGRAFLALCARKRQRERYPEKESREACYTGEQCASVPSSGPPPRA